MNDALENIADKLRIDTHFMQSSDIFNLLPTVDVIVQVGEEKQTVRVGGNGVNVGKIIATVKGGTPYEGGAVSIQIRQDITDLFSTFYQNKINLRKDYYDVI